MKFDNTKFFVGASVVVRKTEKIAFFHATTNEKLPTVTRDRIKKITPSRIYLENEPTPIPWTKTKVLTVSKSEYGMNTTIHVFDSEYTMNNYFQEINKNNHADKLSAVKTELDRITKLANISGNWALEDIYDKLKNIQ